MYCAPLRHAIGSHVLPYVTQATAPANHFSLVFVGKLSTGTNCAQFVLTSQGGSTAAQLETTPALSAATYRSRRLSLHGTFIFSPPGSSRHVKGMSRACQDQQTTTEYNRALHSGSTSCDLRRMICESRCTRYGRMLSTNVL